MSNTGFSFRGSGLYGLVATILGLIALYYVAKGAFWVLTWVAPILLIITLVLDYSVVTDYFKMLWNMILRNPIMGILASVLTFFAFPVVIFFLFGRAWFGYYIRKQHRQFESTFEPNKPPKQQHNEAEFVPYEEVVDNRLDDTNFNPNFDTPKTKQERK